MKFYLKMVCLFALSSAVSATCSPGKEAVKGNDEKQIEQSSNSQEENFAIGDTISFEGEANIQVTSVAYTDERNQFADSQPLHVLVVTYDIENLSDKDYVIGNELELYVNGKKMETYPITLNFDTISAGRTFEGAIQAFAITEEGEYELEVKSSFSFNAEPAIIPFSVQ